MDEPHTGSVTGIVGAGGNVGAVCFSLAFRFMADAKNSLMIMGGVALVSALLSAFIQIEGHESTLFSPFNAPNDSADTDEEAPSSKNKEEQL